MRGINMARTKGSKNTVHSKKAAVDYAAIVEEKAAAKKQIESEIEGLSENIGTLKEQLKRMLSVREKYWRYSLFVLIAGLGLTIFVELTPFLAAQNG